MESMRGTAASSGRHMQIGLGFDDGNENDIGAARPAVTGIGVASLASPQTLVEIEAVARVAG